MPPSIAYVISSHGYGHAARASAVMSALSGRLPQINFEIFTQVNPWFFQLSQPGIYNYQAEWTDVGLVQDNPFIEDLGATTRELDKFLAQSAQIIQRIKNAALSMGCSLFICDIAPVGIAAAAASNLPSVLVENFTWDWIYQGYPAWRDQLAEPIRVFGEWFRSATCHIQTIPVSSPDPHADLVTQPVSRRSRKNRDETRAMLNIPPHAKVVLITTGGIENRPSYMAQLNQIENVYFLVPGGTQERLLIQDNLIAFPHHSNFYHPDLVNASDAVIGKSGYSTIAEIFQAGIPFGYINREHFPESTSLAEFIRKEIPGRQVLEEDFNTGAWLEKDLDPILSLPRVKRSVPNGADQIAELILQML